MKAILSLIIAVALLASTSCSKSGTAANTTTIGLPVLDSTFNMEFVGNVSARCVNVSASGGAYPAGICWSTTDSPTTASSMQVSNIAYPYECVMTGLQPATTYYVRAFATNSAGTAYGKQFQFTTANGFVIGQYYQGGYVFYIDGTGNHGLIVAPSDQSAGTEWGCDDTLLAGDTATAIGTGSQNTASILSHCSDTGCAALVCRKSTVGGYTDWFLPSQNEFLKIVQDMYDTSTCNCGNNMRYDMFGIGQFPNIYYWTSTQVYTSSAMAIGVTIAPAGGLAIDYGSYKTSKYQACNVRAIRAF